VAVAESVNLTVAAHRVKPTEGLVPGVAVQLPKEFGEKLPSLQVYVLVPLIVGILAAH
jgi:hypothetical protein